MTNPHTELIKRLRRPDDYFFFLIPGAMKDVFTALLGEAADALQASESADLPTMQDALDAGDAIIARESEKPAHKCTWVEDSDGYYSTECGEAYVFNDGTPQKNGAYFCHHCGGKLITQGVMT